MYFTVNKFVGCDHDSLSIWSFVLLTGNFHECFSRFQSEYRANFKSPLKYDYVKGAWIGADPPQLHPPDEVGIMKSGTKNRGFLL